MKTSNLILTFVMALMGLSALTTGARAAGTTAGTNITNSATVNYTVGGAAQTPVTSNTATFVVDRKVNLSVTEVGGTATTISYGGTALVTTFQVTNLTNATQDFRLAPTQQSTLSQTAFSSIDTMDMSNIHAYVDANNNGTYEAGTDTAIFIDELAADQSKTVFIVADAPASGLANGIAGVVLTAYTATAGTGGALGADLTATLGLDSASTVDVVFADAAGATDLSRDGASSALDAYMIASTTITFAKTATIISDPVNFSTAPKAIPGAVVEYCLRVSNTGLSTASAVSITDAIPANTTYVASSLYVGGSVLAGLCLADGTAEDDNATGTDESDPNGGSSDGTTVIATLPTIGIGATVTARFRVTLN
jgi:uncharacterized repeat protein (TIGR01451 family)